MVVFTCQSCGESLQKPKVEKHIQFVCHGSPLLTCVDCLKDFRGSEYVSHTQCVTELERYSAKGFTPKPNSQKGLIKQNLWNHMIKEVLKHKDLGVTESRLLNSICMFHNIPRKQSKFQNFMKNTTGCTLSSADAVFKLLEIEWHKFTINREGIDMSSVLGNGKCESVKNSEKQSIAEIRGKSVNIENGSLEGESKDKKLCYVNDNVKQLNKREKKLKRKTEKYLAEINSIENNKNIETKKVKEINSHKKAKKRKKPSREVMAEENMTEEVEEELLEGILEKKKKKKHNDHSHGNMQMQSDGTEHVGLKEQKGKEAKGKNGTVFNWSDTIIQVLQSRSDRELSIKRLCKKVLTEYQAIKGNELHESYEKLMTKFHKKVNKTIGVKVIKDRARLIV